MLIPISKISSKATGVDVSESMLKEAKNNLKIFSIVNANLIESEDCENLAPSAFDFVHSFIVFQHIPVKYGMVIFNNIMNSLKSGGVGVLHFTYFNPGLHGAKGFVKRYFPFLKSIMKMLKREAIQPEMQMNEYDLNGIYEQLTIHGVSVAYSEMTDHGGIKGICLYFKKS
ncbi:MAG: class I SAM-dependent methyltransferase [Woeseiaceae bacterium]